MHVLIVDEGWSQTFEVARGLERAGHAVTVATANGTTARFRWRTTSWLSLPPVASPEFVAAVDELVGTRAPDRVVPLTERVMARLWRAPLAWEARLFPCTEPWQRRLVEHKQRLVEHMAARGFAVPRAVVLDARTEVADVTRRLGLPVVIKPSIGVGGEDVHVVESARAFARVTSSLAWHGRDWIAQEYVDGPTCLFGGAFHDGAPLRWFAGEKLEQHPPRVGPAIRVRSDDHDELARVGGAVMAALRWTGVASADFIRARDGRYVLLEVNPRPWGSLSAATRAGADVVAVLAALLAGDVPAPDLRFAGGAETMIFPRYLLAPRYRGLAGLVHAVRDLGGDACVDWRQPGFAIRALWWLYRAHHPRHRHGVLPT